LAFLLSNYAELLLTKFEPMLFSQRARTILLQLTSQEEDHL